MHESSQRSLPWLVLKLEDLAILTGAVMVYGMLGHGWWLFAVLFLMPDVFMIGYAWNKTLGAVVYNLGHTYFSPLVTALLAFLTSHSEMHAIALIWIAHIGFDRVIGYGLKYADSFKSTHLGRV